MNEQTKTALLLERMDYLKYFEDKLHDFHTLPVKDIKRCQATLLEMIDVRIRVSAEKENRALRYSVGLNYAGGAGGPRAQSAAPATFDGGKGKGPCWANMKGNCSKGDTCNFSHDESHAKGKNGGGKGNPKGDRSGKGYGDAKNRSDSAKPKTAAEIKLELCCKYCIGECHVDAKDCIRKHKLKEHWNAADLAEIEGFKVWWGKMKKKNADKSAKKGEDAKGGKTGEKGKGKDKGKGKGKDKSKEPCHNMKQNGSCSYGENCRFSHDGLTAAPAVPTKAQAKAQAKLERETAKAIADKDKAKSAGCVTVEQLNFDIPEYYSADDEVPGEWSGVPYQD